MSGLHSRDASAPAVSVAERRRRQRLRVGGYALLVIGLILFPLPIPLGAPAIVIALSMLARASPERFRPLIFRVRRRFPGLFGWRRRSRGKRLARRRAARVARRAEGGHPRG